MKFLSRVSLAAGVFLLIICGNVTAKPIKIAVVTFKKKPVVLRIPAVVISKDAVNISSKIPGFIKDLKVDIGDYVKRGQVLLVIEKQSIEESIKQAEENVKRAKAQLENARFNYTRFKRLYNLKVVSYQQFLNVQTAYKSALSGYKQALAALKIAKTNLAYSIVRSPINGIVSAKFANEGDMAAMFQPILRISALSRLQVKANVTLDVLNALKKDGYVGVEIGSQYVRAKIANISHVSDPITRTFEIKADLPEGVKAKPGEFASLIVSKRYRKVLVVDKRALTTRGGITGVFVVDTSGRAHFRMVRLGSRYGKYVEVLSGLFRGEKVVLNPPLQLKNSDRVTYEAQ